MFEKYTIAISSLISNSNQALFIYSSASTLSLQGSLRSVRVIYSLAIRITSKNCLKPNVQKVPGFEIISSETSYYIPRIFYKKI